MSKPRRSGSASPAPAPPAPVAGIRAPAAKSRGRNGAKRAQTREALRRAALRLFAAAPVEGVSIDAIVAEAGVAKGSFYNHFADRQALAKDVAGSIRQALHLTVEAMNRDVTDPAQRVARAVSVFLRHALDDPEAAAALVRIHGSHLAVDDPVNQPVVADVRRGLAGGRFLIPTLDVGVMAVIAIAQVGLLRIAQERSPALAVATSQQLVMLLLRGLGVPTGEAERIAAQAVDAIVRAGGAPAP
jgi:AcrR family transcriptional regulator